MRGKKIIIKNFYILTDNRINDKNSIRFVYRQGIADRRFKLLIKSFNQKGGTIYGKN
jgi:hypothetical protein